MFNDTPNSGSYSMSNYSMAQPPVEPPPSAIWINLLVVTGNKEFSQTLTSFPFIIGREQIEGGLRIDDKSVSRRHAVVDAKYFGISITDNNSSNGTILSGVKLTPGVAGMLSNGDVIKVGRTEIRVIGISEFVEEDEKTEYMPFDDRTVFVDDEPPIGNLYTPVIAPEPPSYFPEPAPSILEPSIEVLYQPVFTPEPPISSPFPSLGAPEPMSTPPEPVYVPPAPSIYQEPPQNVEQSQPAPFNPAFTQYEENPIVPNPPPPAPFNPVFPQYDENPVIADSPQISTPQYPVDIPSQSPVRRLDAQGSFCIQCGNFCPEHHTFCTKCGFKLTPR